MNGQSLSLTITDASPSDGGSFTLTYQALANPSTTFQTQTFKQSKTTTSNTTTNRRPKVIFFIVTTLSLLLILMINKKDKHIKRHKGRKHLMTILILGGIL